MKLPWFYHGPLPVDNPALQTLLQNRYDKQLKALIKQIQYKSGWSYHEDNFILVESKNALSFEFLRGSAIDRDLGFWRACMIHLYAVYWREGTFGLEAAETKIWRMHPS